MSTTGNISLYIHIPLCRKKCPYCHFYSLTNNEHRQKMLIQALLWEIEQKKELFYSKNISSIYLGGGTPSLLPQQDIEKILKKINKYAHINSDCEITLEANPKNISKEVFSSYKNIGINRISLGVQSFDEKTLQFLQRHHSPVDALSTVENAYNSGFKNISIDLMYDIPHQNPRSWKKTLFFLPKLPITHVSLYNLTFEQNTPFFHKKKSFSPFLPSQELSLFFLNEAIKTLENAHFQRYEISAFAKKGYASFHNTAYWKGFDFLGFGPSAFSYFQKKRFSNIKNLQTYYQKLEQNESVIDFEEILTYPKNVIELFIIHLRLLSGVSIMDFEEKHDSLPRKTKDILEELIRFGWIQQKNHIISLTEKGLLFYDSVAEALL